MSSFLAIFTTNKKIFQSDTADFYRRIDNLLYARKYKDNSNGSLSLRCWCCSMQCCQRSDRSSLYDGDHAYRHENARLRLLTNLSKGL